MSDPKIIQSTTVSEALIPITAEKQKYGSDFLWTKNSTWNKHEKKTKVLLNDPESNKSLVLNFKEILLGKIREIRDDEETPKRDSEMSLKGEIQITKMVHRKQFASEKKLDPVLNDNWTICVGGTLKKSYLSDKNNIHLFCSSRKEFQHWSYNSLIQDVLLVEEVHSYSNCKIWRVR